MSTTTPTQRLPLAEAQGLAEEFVRLVHGACERIEIGGSIRRGKADVGDIEIIAIPKTRTEQVGLFEDQTVVVDELDEFLSMLHEGGVVANRLDKNGRAAWGSKYKRLLFNVDGRSFPLDLFCVVPAQFGVIFAIRTGCAEFSHKLVTPRLLGGWLPTGLRVKDGALWDGERMIETPTEQAFFEAVSVQWLLPELRTPERRPVLLKPAGRVPA